MSLTENLQALITFLFQLLVIFPYSALTIRRNPPLQLQNKSTTAKSPDSKKSKSKMISDKVHTLCNSSQSVSSFVAEDSTLAPGEAWKKLYAHHTGHEIRSTSATREHPPLSKEDLERAAECGKWGPTQPSELFLTIYHDALCTLDHSISGCMVSPPLMGSCGVVPLTIISVVPDIMRHMSNVIVRAEKEVFLATNYWQNSVASKYITNAIKELSRRAGERGEKIVMKILYDRGSPKQLFDNHYMVSEDEYTGKAVGLPHPNEIPNIDLQVMNYHKPMLGTFHAKYMVVDRKIAILQSNNIQDNDNMEMMIHMEGPIVDSMYDMALISWHKKLDPPLPSHNSPAVDGGLGSFGNDHDDKIFDQNGALKGHNAPVHPQHVRFGKPYGKDVQQPGVVSPTAGSGVPNTHRADVLTGPSTTDSIVPTPSNMNALSDNVHHEDLSGQPAPGTDKEHVKVEQASGKDAKTEEGKTAQELAQKRHVPSNVDTSVHGHGTTADDPAAKGPDAVANAYFNSGAQAVPESQIVNPSPNNALPEHLTDDPHYDVDIAGEVARVQTAVSPKGDETRVEAVTRHLNHTTNLGFKGTAPECAPHEEMTPYVPMPAHEPFPIAMVCREPHGTPNHKSVYNPQNEAWLSALRNAKKNVFIQSPTLNAEPLVPAILEACERGIDVFCYICLGYNDAGELLPMQGGTNEMIAHKLYASLSAEGKKRLHYFWYIAKDQVVPIVAKKKKRDCHVKLMIVDEHIGIQGNGNQDTQSWFHSQEINVMLDSAEVCKGWIDALRRNQNTHIYGQLSQEDGIWRGPDGKEAEDVIGIDPGKFSWAKGIMGAVERVRGTGGF